MSLNKLTCSPSYAAAAAEAVQDKAEERRLERVGAGSGPEHEKPPLGDPWEAVLEAEKKAGEAEIESPEHYTYSKVEPINVIDEWKLGYNLGNVIKYIARADWKKNKLQDLQKAAWYLRREIARLENE